MRSFKNVLVRLHGSDGLVGLGECDVQSVAGDIDAAFERLCSLAPHLVGLDSLDVETIVAAAEPETQADLGVVAAFDIAAWDLNGKAVGLPVHSLLGGALQRRVPVDYTLGEAIPSEMAARARRMRDLGGFTGFCVKVGGHGAVEEDVLRVQHVREALGAGPRLRVDANGAFNVESAARLLSAIEPYDVEFIEQPLPAGDREGLRRLAAMVPAAISIDEGLRTVADAYALAQTGAVSVFNIKIPKCGGLLLSRRVAAVAAAAGIPWICGGGLAFEPVRQASRHFVAATPLMADYHHEGPGPASQALTADVVRPVVGYADVKAAAGCVAIGDAPGLGVEEDAPSVARHQTASALVKG